MNPRAMVLATVALWPGAVFAGEPVASFDYLPTGNGHGLQIFDVQQNAITQFLERPYRYMRPHPEYPDGEGVIRRDLAFDTYFGVRAGEDSLWLSKQTPSDVGYVDESNIIRSAVTVGALATESLYYAPYGYDGNALVMVLRVTNTGDTTQPVTVYSVHNFKLGTPTNPDSPGDNSEAIAWSTDRGDSRETGPGGGTVTYVPVGGADIATCHADAWEAVDNGTEVPAQSSCNGTDQVQLFGKDLGAIPAGQSGTFAVAILYGDGDAEVERARWDAFAGDRDGAALIDDALSAWEDWRGPMPDGLSAAEARVWRQSEAVLRMGQVLEPYSELPKRKGHGMILASLPPGPWHIGWVRDATYAIVALAKTGHYAEARWALDFFLNAEAGLFSSYLSDVKYRISTVRYFGNGVEEADYSGHASRNVEIDGWGLYLWAARVYVEESGDTEWLTSKTRAGEVVYDVLRDEIAEALAINSEPSGMMIADASIWEVHWDHRQHFLYTTAAGARGLCDMAALSRQVGEMGDRDRYRDLSAKAVSAMRTYFTDDNQVLASSVERLAQGWGYLDGSVVEAFVWNLIAPDDPIATATIDAFDGLVTPVGGYKRIDGSGDPYDNNEWVFVDLRIAEQLLRMGRAERADELIDFVTAQAEVNHQLIPELYNTYADHGPIGAYTGAIPMVGYGGGAYMLTLLARAGYDTATDCGTAAPDDGDAGPGGDGDAGPGGEGDGDDPGGCGCRAGGSSPLAALLLTLALVGLRPRARRRRAGRCGT